MNSNVSKIILYTVSKHFQVILECGILSQSENVLLLNLAPEVFSYYVFSLWRINIVRIWLWGKSLFIIKAGKWLEELQVRLHSLLPGEHGEVVGADRTEQPNGRPVVGWVSDVKLGTWRVSADTPQHKPGNRFVHLLKDFYVKPYHFIGSDSVPELQSWTDDIIPKTSIPWPAPTLKQCLQLHLAVGRASS